QNCGIYPYRAHMLYIATRYIFAGEEMTVGYMLGAADEKDDVTCKMHACHCGAKACTGSMHDSETDYEKWEKLSGRESRQKISVKYGTQLPPLDSYPASINIDALKIYEFNAFGSEKKSPMACG